MCHKIQPRCCYCGLAQALTWDHCVFIRFLVWSAIERQDDNDIPPPEECPYYSMAEVPVLYGCEDNHQCISWFATVVSDFRNVKDDTIRQARQLAAEENFEQYKDDFVKKNCSRANYAPRKTPVPFLVAAQELFHTDEEDEGEEIEIPHGGPRAYIRSRGQEAQIQPARPHSRNQAPTSRKCHRRMWSPGSEGADVPPLSLVVDGCASEDAEDVCLVGGMRQQNTTTGFSFQDKRPRRMKELRPVKPTNPMLTKGNPLIFLYENRAPRSHEWVTHMEIYNDSEYKAEEFMARLLKKPEPQKWRFWPSQGLGSIQKKILGILKL